MLNPIKTIYTKKNPCPICENDSCKELEGGVILCLRCSSSKHAPKGFKYQGQSKDGNWGIFVPTSKGRQPVKRTIMPVQLLQSLSLQERGQAYEHLIQQLPLYPHHLAWLKRRGYSDDFIELLKGWGVRSYDAIRQGPLIGLSPSLPGINLNYPDQLRCRGLLLPTPNWDSQILGFQFVPEDRILANASGRRYDKPNKYSWLSSGPEAGTLKLPHPYNSNPHAFFQPPLIQDARTLGLTEGILKGAYTAYSLGHTVLSTVNTARFNLQQLDMVIKTHDFENIVLFPDAGMMDLKHLNIANAYYELSEMLNELGFTLLVRWWGQDAKEKLDIDDYLMTMRN